MRNTNELIRTALAPHVGATVPAAEAVRDGRTLRWDALPLRDDEILLESWVDAAGGRQVHVIEVERLIAVLGLPEQMPDAPALKAALRSADADGRLGLRRHLDRWTTEGSL
jgi:hypothetical protein